MNWHLNAPTSEIISMMEDVSTRERAIRQQLALCFDTLFEGFDRGHMMQRQWMKLFTDYGYTEAQVLTKPSNKGGPKPTPEGLAFLKQCLDDHERNPVKIPSWWSDFSAFNQA